MAANANELRAAAERLMDYDIPTNDDELDMIARHILATVPADDRPHCPYTLVPMTINADGRGPEMDPAKVVRTEWQVWDELNRCVAVVPPEDEDDPVTVGKLRQQLADVTEQLAVSRMAATAEAQFADEMKAERDRIFAEYKCTLHALGDGYSEELEIAEEKRRPLDTMVSEVIAQLETERDRLREWKHSALSVLGGVHEAWERCGKPGRLGESRSAAMADEVIRLRDELLRARAGLMAVESLIEDSQGVYGLHHNGDPAPWSEIRGDGRYCEWLEDYDAAVLEAVAATKGEP